jgi:hypothetical protein
MLSVFELNVFMLNVLMLNVVIVNVVILNVLMLNVFMMNVVILNVVMLNAVMLNVVKLSVVAPQQHGDDSTNLKRFYFYENIFYKIGTSINYQSTLSILGSNLKNFFLMTKNHVFCSIS